MSRLPPPPDIERGDRVVRKIKQPKMKKATFDALLAEWAKRHKKNAGVVAAMVADEGAGLAASRKQLETLLQVAFEVGAQRALLERDIAEVERAALALMPIVTKLQDRAAREASFAREVKRCAPEGFTEGVQDRSAALYEEARYTYAVFVDCERWFARAKAALRGER